MLERLRVHQYRCFEDFVLPLRRPLEPGGGWTILVGENGTGKSSLLQAIVVGLLDPRPLTSLNNTPWLMCRQQTGPSQAAEISLDLSVGTRKLSLKKVINAEPGTYVTDVGSSPKSVPLVLGFSARRRIARPGELPETKNPEVERVRGLFDPNLPLLAHDAFAELGTAEAQRAFAKVVRDVVVHRLRGTDEHMFPLVDLVQLKGRGGVRTNQQLLEQDRFVLRYGEDYQVRVGIHDLSDGYQAMLSMVLEILTQAAIATKSVPNPARLEAVVLVDELEAHLHPRWQRTAVPLLREVFPRCQFVMTTHSPLVTASARAGEVHVLEVSPEGDVRGTVLEERLSALGAEELYESVFGVPRAAPPAFVEQERAYLEALASPRLKPDPDVASLVEAAWRDRASLRDSR